MVHDALFWKSEEGKIRCFLCPHHCLIGDGKYGLCSVRHNQDGVLKTINYGEITSMAADPVEKKPLYHFKPGKKVLSVGSFGCNLTCDFCQNYSIARLRGGSKYISTEQLISYSISLDNNLGIAFTYNEPSIWFEYVYDTARKAKELYPDMGIVLVTNGYIGLEALKKLLPYIDAMNIDLKSFRSEYYKKICGGDVQSVQQTIIEASRYCHIEITTLLVNGLNDSMEEVEEIASWLAALDRSIPLHLSRYFPAYRMTRPATEAEVMYRAKQTAKKYLNYVYLGNMGNAGRSTYCPKCSKLLIERTGVHSRLLLDEYVCPGCAANIPVIL